MFKKKLNTLKQRIKKKKWTRTMLRRFVLNIAHMYYKIITMLEIIAREHSLSVHRARENL